MAKVRNGLTYLCLCFFLYLNFSEGAFDKSLCLPKPHFGTKKMRLDVPHYRFKSNGQMKPANISEDFYLPEINMDYSVCLPKCQQRCGPAGYCDWKVKDKETQCVCRKGYKAYVTDSSFKCIPQCTVDCGFNTVCNLPDRCHCILGYTRSRKHPKNCIPNCGPNKTYVKSNICQCNAGYEEDEMGLCHPVCDKTICGKFEKCSAPNVCTCSAGYSRRYRQEPCEPVCPENCGKNGYCIRPGICKCYEGYMRVGTNCEPICEHCGKNTYCAEPMKCQCLEGYKPTKEGTDCEPICKNKCGPNAECTQPDKCTCVSGYKMNAKHECIPICAPECDAFSYCVSPGNCACQPGYIGEGNNCEPKCTIECGSNSYCVQPDQCECIAGYRAEDKENRECSSPTAKVIIILVVVVVVICGASIVSISVSMCARMFKKPVYNSHIDPIGHGMSNVDLSCRYDSTLEGIENSSYI